MRIVFFFFFLAFLTNSSSAQDTLILFSGKTVIVKGVEISPSRISYHEIDNPDKQKNIRFDKVFSVKYQDGNEHVLYERDTLEEDDFTPDQMMMYIRGEQAALKNYKNTTNKIGGFVAGAGASFFGFYGIIGPAIYSTIVGSFSPDMEKQKGLDPALIRVDEYREGYQRKVRDKKIKNSILYGLLGFAAGVATFTIATHN